MPELDFVTLDVFTSIPFLGNPLSIVHIPPGTLISQTQKQTITKEFNLFETVFLHRSLADSADEVEEVKIDIFTPDHELPFAGHPTIGAAVHILSSISKTSVKAEDKSCILQIKAGPTVATFSPLTGRARLQIPHAFTIHSDVHIPVNEVASAYGISAGSILPNDLKGEGIALASPVNGLGFLLIQVSSLEALSAINNSGIRYTGRKLGMRKDVENTPLAVYIYYVQEETTVSSMKMRTRMFAGMKEDAATGSAASCLAGYLSMKASGVAKDKGALRTFEMIQGVEVGRKSEIVVEVQTKEESETGEYGVESAWLSGAAVQVMRGKITI